MALHREKLILPFFEMSNPQQNLKSSPSFSPENAADALNEQGFLFQQAIRQTILNSTGNQNGNQQQWKILANEYPVTAADGTETRMDLVLQHTQAVNVHVCLECKRPNPKYKTWLFFDRDKPQLFVEDMRMPSEGMQSPINPALYRQDILSLNPVTEIPVFNFYLEATAKKNSDKFSNTETIEKALRQLIAGQTGMMDKIRRFERGGAISFSRSIPVIVTAAQIFEAQFKSDDVALIDGTIDVSSLDLVPHKFCAVNYHADNSLSIQREYTNYIKSDVLADLNRFQIRTVFIVHSLAINDFLSWAGGNLTKHP